ncbi:MAG TPA: hypothetical protein PK014_11935 [Thermoanaerobaculia bacterium]|nr:hypothetical protein [Thermoanaerobaculia bacterium]HUM28808.1 hypothetical protein [Thermoanaerobaculia bacterium]HXK69065.1 hypothetical protein [Thermoanaerobaculia bacterium]
MEESGHLLNREASFTLIQVETHDSAVSPGEPRRFHFDSRWWTVSRILDRWYEGSIDPERPYLLYVKVEAGGETFLLRYLPYFQRWQGLLLPNEGGV